MSTTTILLVAGAVIVAWPLIAKMLSLPQQKRKASLETLATVLQGSSQTPTPSQPQTFEQALSALAAVRRRLADTQSLDDQTQAAVEKVTQALVAGSGK